MDEIHFRRIFALPIRKDIRLWRGPACRTIAAWVQSIFILILTAVHGTLILERELEEADRTKLIEQIDEDLVLSAECQSCYDFLVSVYVGKDVGFYSDEYFAEETENGTSFGLDDEE